MHTTFRKRSRFHRIYLGRHGRTFKNKAEEEAQLRGEKKFEIKVRDRLVKMTRRGLRQCYSQGIFIDGLPLKEKPTLFISTELPRTRKGLKLVRLGANIRKEDVTVDHHTLLQDRLLGLRYPYTSAHAFFEDHPAEKILRDQVGKFDYVYPGGGESQKMLSVRVRQAFDELEEAYAEEHENVYIECHNSTTKIALSIYLGLSEEAFDEMEDDVPNGSITVLVREGDTRLLTIERKFFIPPLVSPKDYRRLRKEREAETK